MSLICERSESKHYHYQCVRGLKGEDKYMLTRLCRPCLEEQAAESKKREGPHEELHVHPTQNLQHYYIEFHIINKFGKDIR